MTNIVNSTLPTQNNHSEKNKPDGVFVIKQGNWADTFCSMTKMQSL